MELPDEVLVAVFRHLSVRDLDAARGVSRRWHRCAGEPVWRDQFGERYGSTRAARIAASPLWRQELLARAQVLQRWRRLAKDVDVTFNTQLFDTTHIYADFGARRILAVNAHKCKCAVFCARRGSLLRRFSARESSPTLPLSAVHGSRFALAVGAYDGCVTVRPLGGAQIVGEPRKLPEAHTSAVSALWITPHHSLHKGGAPDAVSLASGGTDGVLALANLAQRRDARFFLSSPVLHVSGSMHGADPSTPFVIAVCLDGTVHKADFTDCVTLGRLPPSAAAYAQLVLCSGFALVRASTSVHVLNLETRELHSLDFAEPVRALAVDETYSLGARYCAVALAETVFLYEVGATQPLRVFSPLSHPNLPLPVSALALNPVVMLVSGQNGQTLALDALGGRELRRANSRFPRAAIDFHLYTDAGSLPTSHVLVDTDPFSLRAAIVLKGAVQVLEAGVEKKEEKTKRKPRPALNTRRSSRSAEGRQALRELKEIERTADEEDAEGRAARAAREEFVIAELDEDEQLRLALVMSDGGDARDPDLARALELSQLPADPPAELSADEDEQLRLAIERSLQAQ